MKGVLKVALIFIAIIIVFIPAALIFLLIITPNNLVKYAKKPRAEKIVKTDKSVMLIDKRGVKIFDWKPWYEATVIEEKGLFRLIGPLVFFEYYECEMDNDRKIFRLSQSAKKVLFSITEKKYALLGGKRILKESV